MVLHARGRGSGGMAQGTQVKPIAYRHWAGSYSITLSARKRTVGEIVISRAFAVFRLTCKENRVGSSTGRSAGRAPRRIRSVSEAAR